jgi:hypothetical protein
VKLYPISIEKKAQFVIVQENKIGLSGLLSVVVTQNSVVEVPRLLLHRKRAWHLS